MPQGAFFGLLLAQAVQNGTVSLATVNQAVRRILTPMFAVGLFDRPVRYLVFAMQSCSIRLTADS
jgi:beta-glucosidase